MKITKSLRLLVLFGFIAIASCSSEDDNNLPVPPIEAGIKIMPIGDSRVEGARPDFESYRYELWKNLVTDNWEFDFIGPLMDNAVYPVFMDQNFDKDHAGVGGFTTLDILNNITEAIANTAAPDVALLGIGGNDLIGGISVSTAITNINEVIDILQNSNNSVTIFLEQIAPGRSDFMTPERIALFNEFNSQISNIGTQQTNTTSRVIIVDMSMDWMDSYMADEVHYNEAGAKIIADRYFSIMNQSLEGN